MKKIYTIRIICAIRKPNIWYSNKIGQEFEAQLKSGINSEVVVFEVNPCWFVHIIDCVVVSERVVENYIKL